MVWGNACAPVGRIQRNVQRFEGRNIGKCYIS